LTAARARGGWSSALRALEQELPSLLLLLAELPAGQVRGRVQDFGQSFGGLRVLPVPGERESHAEPRLFVAASGQTLGLSLSLQGRGPCPPEVVLLLQLLADFLERKEQQAGRSQA